MPASIQRAALLQLIEEEDAQIVDVLPEPEYTEAHLPEAVNFPLQELDAPRCSSLHHKANSSELCCGTMPPGCSTEKHLNEFGAIANAAPTPTFPTMAKQSTTVPDNR